MSARARPQRVVYLLHFIDPQTGKSARYRHAGHYLGSTDDLPARLDSHRHGRGARLLEVIKAAGLGFVLARTWEGGRDLERRLKNRHNAPEMCPECGVKPRPSRPRHEAASRTDTAGLRGREPGQPASGQLTNGQQQELQQQRQEEEMFGRRTRAERRQQAEADRLFAEADRLAEQTEPPANYRREITADRAARMMRALAEPMARDAGAQASEPERHPGADWPGYLDNQGRPYDPPGWHVADFEPARGAELNAEIDHLAEQYPELGDPAGDALPAYKVISEEEYRQRFGHLSGREEAEEIARLVAADEIELGPYGPIVTDLDREQTELWLAEDRYAEFAAATRTPETAEEVDWPGEEPGRDAARWTPPEQDEPPADLPSGPFAVEQATLDRWERDGTPPAPVPDPQADPWAWGPDPKTWPPSAQAEGEPRAGADSASPDPGSDPWDSPGHIPCASRALPAGAASATGDRARSETIARGAKVVVSGDPVQLQAVAPEPGHPGHGCKPDPDPASRTFSAAEAYVVADDAVGLVLEYRDVHGRAEHQARIEALGEVAQGLHRWGDADQALDPGRLPGRDWRAVRESEARAREAGLRASVPYPDGQGSPGYLVDVEAWGTGQGIGPDGPEPGGLEAGE